MLFDHLDRSSSTTGTPVQEGEIIWTTVTMLVAVVDIVVLLSAEWRPALSFSKGVIKLQWLALRLMHGWEPTCMKLEAFIVTLQRQFRYTGLRVGAAGGWIILQPKCVIQYNEVLNWELVGGRPFSKFC